MTATCAFGAALGLLACTSTTPETSTTTAAEEAPEPTRDSAGDEAATALETETRTTENDADAAAGEAVSASDDAVVILSAGERRAAHEPATLAEAAAAARAQRGAAGPPVATITDENREERMTRGRLTYVSAPADASSAPSAEAEESAPAAEPTGESYWRTTVRGARVYWRDATRRVDELEARSAELRDAFYATDDPFYREGVVKADWDAALSDLATARAEVAKARADLRRLLDAGRRAGALPGWLRAGLELEPDPPRERDTEPTTVEPVEPTMADEGGRR